MILLYSINEKEIKKTKATYSANYRRITEHLHAVSEQKIMLIRNMPVLLMTNNVSMYILFRLPKSNVLMTKYSNYELSKYGNVPTQTTIPKEIYINEMNNNKEINHV